jgi:lipopolysaccharide transport system ATP-binding protein
VDFNESARNVVFGWLVKSTSGLELGGGAHDGAEGYVSRIDPGQSYDIAFEFTANLFPGIYYLNCGVSGTVGGYDGFLHRVIDGVAFRIRNVYSKVHAGFVDFDYRADCRLVHKDESPHGSVTELQESKIGN